MLKQARKNRDIVIEKAITNTILLLINIAIIYACLRVMSNF